MTRRPRRCHLPDLDIQVKRFQPRQRLVWRSEVPARLCVILGGAMSEAVGSRELAYWAADVVYKPPEERPRLRFGDGGLTTLTVEMGSTRLASLREVGATVDAAFSHRSPRCAGLGMRICCELRAWDRLSPLTLEGLTLELLAEAWRVPRLSKRSRPPAWLARVRARIQDEIDRPLTHADLATEAGVHPVHLAQSFRSWYGVTIGGYTREARVQFAAARLVETDAPLAEVAVAAGYYDQAHFSNAFKRVTGLTPRAYRRSLCPKTVQEP